MTPGCRRSSNQPPAIQAARSTQEHPRSTPGAPKSFQEHPGAPRSTKEHPGAPQEHPGAPQEHPGAPRSTQEHPGAPQEHLGAPGSTQEHQVAPRSTHAGAVPVQALKIVTHMYKCAYIGQVALQGPYVRPRDLCGLSFAYVFENRFARTVTQSTCCRVSVCVCMGCHALRRSHCMAPRTF